MNKEEILDELKYLDLNKEDIISFFDNRVSFILEVKPCNKKTHYTVSTCINIASDIENKDLIENISDLINNSNDLNYTFFKEKTDKDNKKTIFFDCDFKFFTKLARFDGEINQREYNIIQNAILKAYKLLQYIEDNIEDTSSNTNNVIYLYK